MAIKDLLVLLAFFSLATSQRSRRISCDSVKTFYETVAPKVDRTILTEPKYGKSLCHTFFSTQRFAFLKYTNIHGVEGGTHGVEGGTHGVEGG